MKTFPVLCFTALLALGIAGCNGKPNPTAPVSGTVMLGDKAVEGATVTFVFQAADGGEISRRPSGKTDAEGKFTLTTFEDGDGAPPGNYKVMITKIKSDPSAASSAEDAESADPAKAMEDYLKQANKKVEHLLPEGYSNLGLSPLTAEVKDGDNTFEFKLDPNFKGAQ